MRFLPSDATVLTGSERALFSFGEILHPNQQLVVFYISFIGFIHRIKILLIYSRTKEEAFPRRRHQSSAWE